MKAGRDLDVIVAEKFMGWQPATVYSSLFKRGASPNYPGYRLPDGTAKHGCDIPSYSTDIAAAMQVWEKLRNSFKWCCLNISSDYHYVYDIFLTPTQPWGKATKSDKPYIHKPTIKVLCVESLPYGICLAALKSVGYDVKKESEDVEKEGKS